jgi:hypothetical protein
MPVLEGTCKLHPFAGITRIRFPIATIEILSSAIKGSVRAPSQPVIPAPLGGVLLCHQVMWLGKPQIPAGNSNPERTGG